MSSLRVEPVALDADSARAIAGRVHAADREDGGAPLLRHIARVSLRTPAEARVVAWLHESLESVTEHELLAYGLDDDELRALRLLGQATESRSRETYLAQIELIARAAGRSGNLARTVKIADLEDRRLHPPVCADGWSAVHELALRRLQEAQARHPYEHA